MNKIKILTFCFLSVFLFASCERYPISALTGIPSTIDSWPYPWCLYDDEINTKGSMEPFVWPNSEFLRYGRGTLDFACRENPQSGTKCFKMTWIGNVSVDNYAGFGLMSTELAGGTKDLSTSGYTSLKFYVRGYLYENCAVKIEIPNSSVYVTLIPSNVSSSWQEIEIPITNVSSMTAIEYYLAISMFAATGTTNGGTIYLDNIRLCKD